jgi:hypothetical protein
MEAISRIGPVVAAEVTRRRGSGVERDPARAELAAGGPVYVIGSALEGGVLKEGGVC